jgi:hypothetical protein
VRTPAVLQGAGLATLYIAPFASNFLTPTLGDAYHRIHPLTSIYRAILIGTILLWIGGTLGFLLLDQLPLRWRRAVWLFPAVLLVWLFFRCMTGAFAAWPNIAFQALKTGHLLTPVAVILGLELLLLLPRVWDRCIAGIRAAYAICGFGLLVIVPRIAYHALRFEPREQASFERAALPPVPASEPRIVWILMDELSYDLVFDHRPSDVFLPNFDSLAKSSVTFSALQPVGNDTENILPALLLGRPVVAMRKPYADPPSYRSTPDGPWQRFNQDDTIFADARSLGWTTGVAGWYNPYCRLLHNVLDRCSWQYAEPGRADLTAGLVSTSSVSKNLLALLPSHGKIDSLLHRPAPVRTERHRSDYTGVMAQAEDILRDSRIRFVFLHLPVPHPPGIFDRRLHKLSDRGTYLDNLALADQTLGELRSILQATPAADNTTLILSSDHSWRTFMWQGTEDWSAEGTRATDGGHFDKRPVLMVHLPRSDSGQVIAKPLNLLVVHSILDALLHGQVHTPADLALVSPEVQEATDVQSHN